jgi:hypothetical protein
MIGSFFRFQEDLLVQVTGGPVSQAFRPSGLATENLEHFLFRAEIVFHHRTTVVNAIFLGGEAAHLGEPGETGDGNPAETVQTFPQIVNVTGGFLVVPFKEFVKLGELRALDHEMMLLILEVESLKAGQGDI